MSIRLERIESGADRARILHWLSLPADPSARAWVIREGGSLGAAATLLPAPTTQVWVRVAQACRGRGYAHLLWRAVLDCALEHRITRLAAVRPIDEEALTWAERNHLRVVARLTEFSASLRQSQDRQRRAWARISHRVPAQSSIISLRQAQEEGLLSAVAGVLAPAVGGNSARWLRRAEQSLQTRGPPDFDPQCSVVLRQDRRIIGAQTTRFDPVQSCWFIEAITVVAEYRHGWASLALRIAAGEAKERAALSDEVRFRARDDHADTLRMARHLGAKLRSTQALVVWTAP